MLKNNINIQYVAKNSLCTGCGTCASLCPQEAIELSINEAKGIYIPRINEEICNNCSICVNVCPGHEFDHEKLNLKIFGKQPDNYLIGNYMNCYIGHSNDTSIRYNSSSGGLITQLLIFALEERIIDGALVTRMKKNNPLEPEPFIARSSEEIFEASQSKYCPVPTNIALKEILNSKKGEKFAVVGLPCQLNGIRNAESVNEKLKSKIIFYFGIFCSHNHNFSGTDYFLSKLMLKKEQVKSISYRGRGWPGKIDITLKNGEKKTIPYQSSLWNTIFNCFLFTPQYCLFCSDLTSEISDISFGDPWLPTVMEKEDKGKSIIISRSNDGENLLNLAIAKKYIKLSSISSNDVIKSQKTFLNIKKINIIDRIKFRKFLGKKSPILPKYNAKINFYNKFLALFLLFNSFLGSKIGNFVKFIPLKIFKIQLNIFYILLSLAIKDHTYGK